MKSVSSCTHCGTLTIRTDPYVCGNCYVNHGWVGTMVPAGVLLDPTDLAKVAADEGDSLLAECARALGLLEANEKREPT